MTFPNALYWENVEAKWRVPAVKAGVYNRLVLTCPECENDVSETMYDCAVGFAQVHSVVMVVECPKCGQRFFSHATMNTYKMFLIVQEDKKSL